MNGGVGSNYIEMQHQYHLERLYKPTNVHFEGFSAPMPRYFRRKIMQELDEDDKIMIQTLYMNYVNDLKIKHENDLRRKFYKKHPNGDDHDFIMWKNAIEDRKEELYLKHTKKQTVL